MRKTLTALLAALAFALALAACGGSGHAAPGPAAAPPAASAIAGQIGATNVHAIAPTLYAYDEVLATWHDSPVDIATFRTNALRDQWVQAASRFSGVVATGDRYAVIDG